MWEKSARRMKMSSAILLVSLNVGMKEREREVTCAAFTFHSSLCTNEASLGARYMYLLSIHRARQCNCSEQASWAHVNVSAFKECTDRGKKKKKKRCKLTSASGPEIKVPGSAFKWLLLTYSFSMSAILCILAGRRASHLEPVINSTIPQERERERREEGKNCTLMQPG